uniref:hypothetical protein n=1 Tax=Phymatolithon calcareum TaxID=1277942 RepID=UPI0023F4565D|nr:hypothetical protein P6G74_pgp063 [Phymatolithon calcareum]WEA76939.1 hypothetical protein [Phymatolithon calcareum]
MILFNLIFAQNISEFPDHFLVKINSQVKIEDHTYKKNTKYLSTLPCLISNVDFLTKSKDHLADKELISNNLFKRLLNKFWQQTIFLSVPTKLSDKYTAQLNSLNLVKDKVNQKKFLSEFSRSLIDGSIESSLSKERFNDYRYSSIKYIWRKGFNPKYFVNWNLLFPNANQKSSQKIQKRSGDPLKIRNFPLFIVTNHLGQMVIAEPPGLSYVSKSIINLFPNQSSLRPLYQGWFFVSNQDAQEYLRHIKKQYRIADTNNKLKIFTCNLETFYKLSHNSRNTVQFRLVPDLHEIGELVTKYSSYNSIVFDENQNHGKDYFQGQPIYTILNSSSDYYYQVPNDKQKMKYKPVFTSYETAVSSWDNFVKNQGHSKILKYPKFLVYNLEDFLESKINDSSQNQLPFIFIPSKNSYEFIKNSKLKQTPHIIYENVFTYFSYFKLWTKRVLWSLTSRQSHDW